MPPKTRTNRAIKALKENECPVKSNKVHKTTKELKTRKPLADKTNSASDDNASVLVDEIPLKVTPIKNNHDKSTENSERPRRARRLPNRYKENNILKNVSNNDVTHSNQDILKSNSRSTNKQGLSPVKSVSVPVKNLPVLVSPFKSPKGNLNNSLLKKRPKRICRLPSKFDDHSISPNKFIPLQPINASTPLAKKTKKVCEKPVLKTLDAKKTTPSPKVLNETSKQKTLKEFFNSSIRSDTNNNAKQNKKKTQVLSKASLPKPKQTVQKLAEKSFSIRILDDNKKSRKRDSSKLDVYEFTYDPEEEPPPTKKKKKKTTKKPSKPKTVKVKSNYDKNLAKALATLKNTVSKPDRLAQDNPSTTHSTKAITSNTKTTELNTNKEVSIVYGKNYNSVRVEDIAMDMQADDVSIDYSPVNSPNRPATPRQESPKVKPNDPLNLQDGLSFFDELPAASSSMNVSVRHPLASPWRVEFNNLPIKWQANTYVKPNMTPAVESSFINSNDSNKKHVYTNMVAEGNDTLPEVIESGPSLKQTSIMSFIKEVIDKNASRKSKVKSTPVKANSLFEDVSNTSIAVITQKKQSLSRSDPKVATPQKNSSHEKSNNSSNISTEINNSDNQDISENSITPKDKNKETDKNITYFGFDSEDQENISPKKKNKARSLRSRTRGILQELNNQKGPMRAILPVTAKSKPLQSDVDKVFDGVKSATEPPVFPEVVDTNTVQKDQDVLKATELTLLENEENDDAESVHLFEDIEVVHHHKPTRKSYGKPVKKVAFNKPATLDSGSGSTSDIEHASSDEDLEDLSFKLPSEKPKKTIKRKKTNKQKLSKKEEKEVEAWAAGFNSMCEDINEFDLVVE